MKLFLYNVIHPAAISSPSGPTTVSDTMCLDIFKQMLNGLCIIVFPTVTLMMVGRDSVVGIATRYWLEGPGIESRWGLDFPHLSRPARGPTQPPVQCVPGLSRG